MIKYLKGSRFWNFNLEDSDIDTICFTVPTLNDLLNGVNIKDSKRYEDGIENGNIRDIRYLPILLSKGDINSLEILLTENPLNKDELTDTEILLFKGIKSVSNSLILDLYEEFYISLRGIINNRLKTIKGEINCICSDKVISHIRKHFAHINLLMYIIKTLKKFKYDNKDELDFKKLLDKDLYSVTTKCKQIRIDNNFDIDCFISEIELFLNQHSERLDRKSKHNELELLDKYIKNLIKYNIQEEEY